MENAIEVYERDLPLKKEEIIAQVKQIQEVMEAVMKEGHHYGTIPGTPKPTLYKPGAEKLLLTFHIGADPRAEVEDLSTSDEIRYRVAVKGFTQGSGRLLGAGIGECSSNEEKYKWRKPVCDEEFNETPDDRKRIAWKRGEGGKTYQQKQIRTQPSDVANTILKMAKKRALIDMTLTVTAASDIFDQDLEDMADNGVLPENGKAKAPVQMPKEKKEAEGSQDPNVISEPQRKRFYAIAKNSGASDEQIKAFLADYGFDSSKVITKEAYEEICENVKSLGKEPGSEG